VEDNPVARRHDALVAAAEIDDGILCCVSVSVTVTVTVTVPALANLAVPVVCAAGSGVAARHAVGCDDAALGEDRHIQLLGELNVTDAAVSAAVATVAATVVSPRELADDDGVDALSEFDIANCGLGLA
jgi:hypothetical protein